MIELDCNLITTEIAGKAVGISGNASIARGIIEAGIEVITSYPGTPCAEILENLAAISHNGRYYLEWSTNEKVAFEVAAAAAIAGIRSAFVTKHVGMNVASDSLMHLSYGGVNAGMVIISADDPGAYDSPIEQDSRFYARAAEILGMEPFNQQEAKDMIVAAIRISEKVRLPAFIRLTNRILYGRGKVVLGEIRYTKRKPYFVSNDLRWFIAGRNAVRRHQELHKQQDMLNIISEGEFNKIEWASNKKKYGIIASGVPVCYAKEVIRDINVEQYVSILKLGYFNPLPYKYIKKFLSEHDEILVLEELEPFIEEGVKRIAADISKNVHIYGKLEGQLPHTDALSQDVIRSVMRNIWFGNEKKDKGGGERDRLSTVERERLQMVDREVHKKFVTFCPGCPHRASLYILKSSLSEAKDKFIITGDIGCYLLGKNYPFLFPDIVFCMGASIGIGAGFAKAGINKRIIAIIGDSTFLHAGIPSLINCCYNEVDILVYILDNRTVAMTGLQPYPGVGLNAERKRTKKIKIEKIVEACNVDYLRLIDPFDINRARKILGKALAMRGQRVVISRHECAQVMRRDTLNRGKVMKRYKIDRAKCRRCLVCIRSLGCPAIFVKDKEVYINKHICTGCGLCKSICPHRAIVLDG